MFGLSANAANDDRRQGLIRVILIGAEGVKTVHSAKKQGPGRTLKITAVVEFVVESITQIVMDGRSVCRGVAGQSLLVADPNIAFRVADNTQN